MLRARIYKVSPTSKYSMDDIIRIGTLYIQRSQFLSAFEGSEYTYTEEIQDEGRYHFVKEDIKVYKSWFGLVKNTVKTIYQQVTYHLKREETSGVIVNYNMPNGERRKFIFPRTDEKAYNQAIKDLEGLIVNGDIISGDKVDET